MRDFGRRFTIFLDFRLLPPAQLWYNRRESLLPRGREHWPASARGGFFPSAGGASPALAGGRSCKGRMYCETQMDGRAAGAGPCAGPALLRGGRDLFHRGLYHGNPRGDLCLHPHHLHRGPQLGHGRGGGPYHQASDLPGHARHCRADHPGRGDQHSHHAEANRHHRVHFLPAGPL